MINVYPYPFSKNVKSLPDPPPAKAREIKDIQNKIYRNDYSWLIEAINNLKKCFHLCNLCSQKFKYMRQIAEDSNVHYEHNWSDQILNKAASKNQMVCKFYENTEKDDSCSDVCTDTKHNILKINGKGRKNHHVCCNQGMEAVNEKNANGIIFSNSLYSNKDEILSFDKDVYIFVGDQYINKNEKQRTDNESHDINQNKESSDNISNNCGVPKTIDSRAEEMCIHIKRHFKDSISYFACEHIKFNELQNLNNENSYYDKIDIFAYDKENIGSMNDCVLNLKKGNDLIHLTQPSINEISTNEEIKEKVKEIHKFYINVINKINEENVDASPQNDVTNFHKEDFTNGTSKVVPFSLYDESMGGNKKNGITNSTDLDSLDNFQKRNDTKTQAYVCPPKIPESLINELTKKLKNRKVSCCLKDLENNKKDFFSDSSEHEEYDQMKKKLQNNYATYTLKSKSSTFWNNKKNSLKVNGNNCKKNKTINDVNINEFMMKLSRGSVTTHPMQKLSTFRSGKFDKQQENSTDSFIQKDTTKIIEDRNSTDNEYGNNIKESCFLKAKENLQNEVNTLEIIKATGNPQNNNLQIIQPLEKNSLYKKHNVKDDFSDFSDEKINQIYEQKKLRTVPYNEFLKYKEEHLESIKQDCSKWHTLSNISPFQLNNKLLNVSKEVVPHSTNADPISNYNMFTCQKSIDVAVQTNYDSNLTTSMHITKKFRTKDCSSTTNNPSNYVKNDKECERKKNSIILPIPILKSSVCGLKNYENSKIRNPFTEISYNSMDDSNTHGTKEHIMNCSIKIDANSAYLTMEEKNAQDTLKSSENHGNDTIDVPSYPFINKQEHSLVMSPLAKKTHDVNHQHKEVAKADALSRKKESNHHDHLSFFRNPFTKESIFYNTKEKPEHFSTEQRDDITKESMDKVKNIPMGNIFNLCKQPSEINVHNRIYASDLNRPCSDTKKVIYFNNNYFFNIDKEGSFENNGTLNQYPTIDASSSSNFNKLDLKIYQNGTDGCSIKCLHNTLPNHRTLVKEFSLDTSLESSVSDENITKLQKLRNKHFKNNELQYSSHKKKPILSKRYFEIKKNYYYPYQKSFIKEDKNIIKEVMYNEYSRKNKANHVTMICDVPESPQEQEKIPKPFASQLDIEVQAYLKKTPSYPFEEYEF